MGGFQFFTIPLTLSLNELHVCTKLPNKCDRFVMGFQDGCHPFPPCGIIKG